MGQMMLSLPEMGLYISFLLFVVGFFGIFIRKNIIFIMLSIEIMLNSANLAFVSASKLTDTMDGQVMMFFVIAAAACEAGVGLAIIISLYRRRSSVNVDDLGILKG
jgi:NADH-quinone oxidoreductase subunit K